MNTPTINISLTYGITKTSALLFLDLTEPFIVHFTDRNKVLDPDLEDMVVGDTETVLNYLCPGIPYTLEMEELNED